MKNEIGTLEDYMRFIDGKMNHLRKLDGDLSKEEWEIILTHEGFAEKYIVTKTPDILKGFGVDAMIYMTRSNMAYILSMHSKEYSVHVYKTIKDTIDMYDILMKGEHSGNQDYRFFKQFSDEIGKIYGIDIVIDKPSYVESEYIVHLNYHGRRKQKSIKAYARYKGQKNLLIDIRK